MSELHDLSIVQASELLRKRSLSASELLEATLRRIEETEPLIHAWATLTVESARSAADQADQELSRGGWRGPLHGIPLGVKDLLYTRDAPTEAGSKVLAGFSPGFDAAVVKNLRDSGAVLVGKTVTHEFAYGQNVPATRNPWRLDSYPGGSSAGSGAAVAARSIFGAIGTDTGGSVRTPAAVNGIVGLKPTYGLVSRHGVVPMSPSLDHVGPLTRTTADCAAMLQAIVGSGQDRPDGSTGPIPDFSARLGSSVAGVRLGLDAHHFLYEKVEPAVRAATEAALASLERLGAVIVQVLVPELEWSPSIGNITTLVDASAWHRELLRTRLSDYHPGTRLMLELGELIPACDYVTVQKARTLVRDGVRAAFQEHQLDALIGPTIPVTAPRLDQLSVDLVDQDGGAAALSTLVHHEYPANVTGLPSISVPSGLSDSGLPVGLQFIGRPFAEPALLGIAHAFEQSTPWHTLKPELATRRR